MKRGPVVILVSFCLLTFIVAGAAAVPTAFSFLLAWVLTLLLEGMDMRQAITPGAVLAVSSLYFSYAFLTHRISIPVDDECVCDECRKDGG